MVKMLYATNRLGKQDIDNLNELLFLQELYPEMYGRNGNFLDITCRCREDGKGLMGTNKIARRVRGGYMKETGAARWRNARCHLPG